MHAIFDGLLPLAFTRALKHFLPNRSSIASLLMFVEMQGYRKSTSVRGWCGYKSYIDAMPTPFRQHMLSIETSAHLPHRFFAPIRQQCLRSIPGNRMRSDHGGTGRQISGMRTVSGAKCPTATRMPRRVLVRSLWSTCFAYTCATKYRHQIVAQRCGGQ
jgi:hypothetical protein